MITKKTKQTWLSYLSVTKIVRACQILNFNVCDNIAMIKLCIIYNVNINIKGLLHKVLCIIRWNVNTVLEVCWDVLCQVLMCCAVIYGVLFSYLVFGCVLLYCVVVLCCVMGFVLCCVVICCIVLCCLVLHCISRYCAVLLCCAVWWSSLFCNILNSVMIWCVELLSFLYSVALRCAFLNPALNCTVLPFVELSFALKYHLTRYFQKKNVYYICF